MKKIGVLFFLIGTSCFAQTKVFKGNLSWFDIIKNVETEKKSIVTPTDLETRMAKNGNLVLDSCRIILSITKEEPLLLIANELRFTNAVIETNGNSLTIICNKLVSNNGSIISFNKYNIQTNQNNLNAKNNGTVKLVILDTLIGKLNVFLDGQNGANGKNETSEQEIIHNTKTKTVKEPYVNPDTYYDTGSRNPKPRTTQSNVVVNSTTRVVKSKNATDGERAGDGGNLYVYKTKLTKPFIESKINFTGFAGKKGLGGKAKKNSNRPENKAQNGIDGLEGKVGFMYIEKYNFTDFFTP